MNSKLLIAIGIISVLGISSFIIYKQIEISNRQKDIETNIVKQKDLQDSITRSMNEYATRKDIEKYIKDNGVNLQVIQDDLDKLHAEISAVNDFDVNSDRYIVTNIPSTSNGKTNPNPQTPTVECNGQQIECKDADLYGYLKNQKVINVNERFGTLEVPFGKVGFSAWQKYPWELNISPRSYHITSVVGVDENQRQYFYNKMSIKVDGKSYDLKIDTAETKQVYPESKMYWWNPRLYLGVSAGLNLTNVEGEMSPHLDISMMGYGKFKNQPDFSILQVGVGYNMINENVQFSITPISYNIGKHIPLTNNLYIGPSIGAGTNGNIYIMGGIHSAL